MPELRARGGHHAAALSAATPYHRGHEANLSGRRSRSRRRHDYRQQSTRLLRWVFVIVVLVASAAFFITMSPQSQRSHVRPHSAPESHPLRVLRREAQHQEQLAAQAKAQQQQDQHGQQQQAEEKAENAKKEEDEDEDEEEPVPATTRPPPRRAARRRLGGGDGGCDGRPWDDDLTIEIHVLGYQRPRSLGVLLAQLRDARYDGWAKPVPLVVHLDDSAKHPRVAAVARAVRWPHGALRVSARAARAGRLGLRRMWMDAVTAASAAAGPNALMVVFEDDLRVSALYFQWLLAAVARYGRAMACRDAALVGFSLSPLKVDELARANTRWRARDGLARPGAGAFLSQVPSSWGAAYWSDRWLEFAAFARVRQAPPYFNSTVVVRTKADSLKLTPVKILRTGIFTHWSSEWGHRPAQDPLLLGSGLSAFVAKSRAQGRLTPC